VWKTQRQREQQTAGRGVFVPLVFQPGEAFQFNWSEDWAIIGGERIKLQAAHSKLCYSRAFIVRAYLLQTHEMLFDAHGQEFRVFDGVPHCHTVETGNNSFRFKACTAATKGREERTKA
jgi:transposase